jgi:hypothetical protein
VGKNDGDDFGRVVGRRVGAGVAGGGERGEGVVVEVGESAGGFGLVYSRTYGAPRLLKKNGMSCASMS